MKELNSHIVSSLNWHTLFDKKEKATELQDRLSVWSKIILQKEIDTVFSKICPSEQTWRIPSLELDLGTINYDDLELVLSEKLKAELTEKLMDLIIYASKRGSKAIEILNEDSSQITILKNFLLNGIMPWNYTAVQGSVKQLMTLQLQNNRQQTIDMLWDVGAMHENVRKRIAWQFDEPIIIKIIKGLEPNNYFQIVDFSNELITIQKKENIIQTNIDDFKKNLWHWVLNYLLNERGTIYNKIAFVKSSIRQMAGHYNIGYLELVELISQAIINVNKQLKIKPEFIQTLAIISKECASIKKQVIGENVSEKDYWSRLEYLLRDPLLRKTKSQKIEYNDLILSLYKEDRQKFATLIVSLGNSKRIWKNILTNLNIESIKIIFNALSPSKASIIIESISLLNKLGKEVHLKIEQKQFFEIGIQFLVLQSKSRFRVSEFLSYCIAELSKNTGLSSYTLLNRLIEADVPSSSKTISSLEIYINLNSIFQSEITQSFSNIEVSLTKLLKKLMDALILPNSSTEDFLFLQKLLIKKIGTSPESVLKAMVSYSNKEILYKLLPSILDEDTSAHLIKYSNAELQKSVSALHRALLLIKHDKRFYAIIELMEENIRISGLQAYILHASSSSSKFIEFILTEISGQIPRSKWKLFGFFVDEFIVQKEIRGFNVSSIFIQQLRANQTYLIAQELFVKVNRIISVSQNKQAEVEKIIAFNISNKQFIKWLAINKKEATIVLNYILPGALKLMEDIIGRYKPVLVFEIKNIGVNRLDALMQNLYFNCILNYGGHKGSIDLLKRNFEMAVVSYFSISERGISKILGETISPPPIKKYYQLKNGAQISFEKLFLSIQQCFDKGVEVFVDKGNKYKLQELIVIGLEAAPKRIREIIFKIPITGDNIKLLQSSVSFSQFCVWILSDKQSAHLNSIIESIKLLNDMVSQIAPGTISQKLLYSYWSEIFMLIKNNVWSKNDFKKLVLDSFFEITKVMDIGIDSIVSEIKKNNIKLTPLLTNILMESFSAFSVLGKNLAYDQTDIWLSHLENKGLLDSLLHQIIIYRQIPSWVAGNTEKDVNVLTNKIITQHPVKLLRLLKQHVMTDQQIRWLHKSIKFKELSCTIIYMHGNMQTLLNILEKLYDLFGKITIRGISNTELQNILFGKLLISWANNNWKLISIENIWNELIWDVCLKWAILKGDFLHDIEKIKFLLPPSLQISFENINDSQIKGVPLMGKPVLLASPAKKGALKLSTEKFDKIGIPVRNAGVVILNTYINTLFNRLGLLVDNNFKDKVAQADAVHYLQYIVTGFSQTDEALLPLNKLLCGLSFDYPIQNRISISNGEKNIIEGLIQAAINYWPAIGKCSLNGFRGNWLVREGLLVNDSDNNRYELIIEKRPYDILLDKLPFSFSIIKYKWMEKPLHVTWLH